MTRIEKNPVAEEYIKEVMTSAIENGCWIECQEQAGRTEVIRHHWYYGWVSETRQNADRSVEGAYVESVIGLAGPKNTELIDPDE